MGFERECGRKENLRKIEFFGFLFEMVFQFESGIVTNLNDEAILVIINVGGFICLSYLILVSSF